MFFGRSKELDKREQRIIKAEQYMNQRLPELQRYEDYLRAEKATLEQKAQTLNAREAVLLNTQIVADRKEKDLRERENKLAHDQDFLNISCNAFLNKAKSDARKIIAQAEKEAESLREKAYREGHAKGMQEGLSTGRRSFHEIEGENQQLRHKLANARHAARRRAQKSQRLNECE